MVVKSVSTRRLSALVVVAAVVVSISELCLVLESVLIIFQALAAVVVVAAMAEAVVAMVSLLSCS